MALRKLKDLIREMIFENQTHEHEYAEVMATLVFDMDAADDYEQQLDDADTLRKQYDDKIEKIKRALGKKDEKIQAQKSLKGQIPAEEFKAGMAKLNKQKKILGNLQTQTIEDRMQKGFASLSPVVKKYAVLRHLANTCIKKENFPTKPGPNDVFIYADEDEFKSSQIASNFSEISDYVDYIFGNRESKIKEPQDIIEIIKNDAIQLGIDYKTLTAANIVNVYNRLLERIAEENRNKQTEKEQIEQSQIGLQPIQDFGNGLVMYRLLPDTEYYNEHGEHRNLVYESDQMGICIGNKNQSYSQKILKQNENQYYTLRSRQKNGQLIPHCTIEVNGNTVRQVKGRSNSTVNANYIKPVRAFLKEHLNCAFPGEEDTDGKRKLYDYSNIGFIEDLKNNTVDIFNLPPETAFGTISYELINTKGADIKNIKSISCLSCSDQTITQTDINTLLSMSKKKHIDKIDFSRAKLTGDIDFGYTENLDLEAADLSNVTNIKINPSTKRINLNHARGLKCNLDFSNVSHLYLFGTDLSNVTDIKFNPNTEEINLCVTKGLKGNLDFSNVKFLNLDHADLSMVTNIKINENGYIKLSNTSGLKGEWNFSNIEELDLNNADLSNITNITFNQNAKEINLNYVTGLKGDLDFSKVEELLLSGINLSKLTNIKFNPNAKRINLSKVTGFKGNLDFSNVEDLDLSDADLSNVDSIKINPNAQRLDLSKTIGLKGDLDCSNVIKLYLNDADLSNINNVIFNPNADTIQLEYTKGLRGDLDCSNIQRLKITGTDLSKVTNIKMNSNAKELNLFRVKGLHGEFDFSNVKDLKLDDIDLSQIIFKSKILNLHSAKKLRGNADFSMVEELDLSKACLSGLTSIKFNPKAKKLNLHEVDLSGDLDFSNVLELNLYNTDLSNVTSIKLNPNAKELNLSGVKGLQGNFDFTNVKKLSLYDADLSNIAIKAKELDLFSVKLHGDVDFSRVEDLRAHTDLSNIHNIKFNTSEKSVINLGNAKGLHGNLDFGDCTNLWLGGCELYNAVIKAKRFEIYSAFLRGNLDFTGVYELYLNNMDLSNVSSLLLNSRAKKINLSGSTGLMGQYDFSGVNELDLSLVDLSKVTDIKLNPNATSINLSDTKGLKGDLDFGNCEKVGLNRTDLSNVTRIKAKKLKFTAIGKLSDGLNLVDVEELDLSGKDLSGTNIQFNPNAKKLDLSWSKGLKGNLDFSGVQDLDLDLVDLSDTKIKFNPNADKLNLTSTKGLKGELDFSNVKELNLYSTDLSNVTGIKLNPRGTVIGLSTKDRLRFAANKVVKKMQTKFPGLVRKSQEQNE